MEQLLVPRAYIPKVLYLAHNHLLGSHLGAEKTYERVVARFYWPGVKRDIEDYCRRCATCQLHSPKPTYRNRGYWQVPLAPQAKEKTAFATPDGLYQYRVLSFGVHGAPATFQRLMDRVPRPHQQYAAAYLDDIVIHSEAWEDHIPRVEAVLSALREAGLTANPAKCRLGLEEAKYLGHVVGRGCIRLLASKAESIATWPQLATKKQVRTFLGLVGYYRQFVPSFAARAAPLHD